MKIGVLGGTFDPLHNGHLLIARETMKQLGLDEIIFVPAGRPWLKENTPITPAEHRVAMVRLAIKGEPTFKLSTVEIERPGPSYTVDTIAAMKKRYTGDDICFIMGWDSLSQLPRWREPDRLITLCRLVAVARPGYPRPDLAALEKAIPGLSRSVVLFDEPQVDIDATGIRERVARGEPVSDLVPGAVERYIKEHKLYLAHQEAKT